MKVLKWALFGVAGIAVAGFLVVTALGSAVTSAEEPPGGGHARSFTRALADVLGITPSQLQEDRKAALEQMLATAVANGRITQEQADKILQHPRAAAGGLRAGANLVFDAAAGALHMTNEDLRIQLANGNSLADIAAQQNVSVDQLKAAMTAEIETQLDQAVTDGRITQEQKDKVLTGLAKRIDTILTREPGRFMYR